MTVPLFQPRPLPRDIAELNTLALDLFWTWSHSGDRVWALMDPELWERTRNPWVILQSLSDRRLKQLAKDPDFRFELERLIDERREHLKSGGWFEETHKDSGLGLVAYFSMEFGLSEALPIYAGGLGILAGDFLKASSDLGVPVVGVGLLFQEGYFRQLIKGGGEQEETYPYNEPNSLPIQPVEAEDGTWLKVSVDLPGRSVKLRVWRATVGRTTLYLLDSNDPFNVPSDRGVTAKLYGGGHESRLLQEMVLGVGGWRALAAQGLEGDVCHLNEGHAAFVVLERARSCMQETGLSFWEALWATRAGNVFTSHTPVPSGFDVFDPDMVRTHLSALDGFNGEASATGEDILENILALGRADPDDGSDPFNMAYLAIRGCGVINGVSRLHGEVSRHLFRDLFPRWPEAEIPIDSVTNGVHMPSWDSAASDKLWTRLCGKDRWRSTPDCLEQGMARVGDEELWELRSTERQNLIRYLRERRAQQLVHRGGGTHEISEAARIFDPNALTLGFARRFTEYKRPTLLLTDADRLLRILTNAERPVQIAVAGKAHPNDTVGKAMVRDWVEFAARPEARQHVVFLEDYDIAVAEMLVQGVDVWVNTPRRPWEACGTSGMKVLVNGGVNLSELDGWWAEAYAPDVGWALGDGDIHGPEHDRRDADALYRLLEDDVVPEFYDRNSTGFPRRWLEKLRRSMATLAPQFSSTRMVQDYVDRFYVRAAQAHRERQADRAQIARDLRSWERGLRRDWPHLHFGPLKRAETGDGVDVSIAVYLGDVSPDWVQVELYADARDDEKSVTIPMTKGNPIPGTRNGYVYNGKVSEPGAIENYTARARPFHERAFLPAELPLIGWQR